MLTEYVTKTKSLICIEDGENQFVIDRNADKYFKLRKKGKIKSPKVVRFFNTLSELNDFIERGTNVHTKRENGDFSH